MRRREINGPCLQPTTSIPCLDEMCGSNHTYRNFIECGETWEQLRVDNMPRAPETYDALHELATNVLDPVIEHFGAVKLTYGFASPALTKHIGARIAPNLDQHAACEVGARGTLVCPRRGAAVDFLVDDQDMHEVARWISANCSFDRLYLYGRDNPIHASIGPERSRAVYEMKRNGTRRVPRRLHW